MKKIKLIYNPVAGDRSFLDYLDEFIKRFQCNYFLEIYRCSRERKIIYELENLSMDQDKYKAILVAGGDGTVNKVVNGMMKKKIELPLGIIPAGTTNDLATYLNIPSDFKQCFEILLQNNQKQIDVGKINNQFFINVCVGGLLSTIPHSTETRFKNKLGRLAYYINSIKEFPNLKPLPIKLTTSSDEINEEVIMFMVLNSNHAGGFKHLTRNSIINDGLFEFIAIKAKKLYRLPNILIKIFQNKYLQDDSIITLQDNFFKIELNNNQNTKNHCDIDGEKGPIFPLEISVKQKALTVLTG